MTTAFTNHGKVRSDCRAQRGQAGTATIWFLGLAITVLTIGSFGFDLWQGINLRRELLGLAESAAVAASSGIDETAWRERGELVLSYSRASYRARQVINMHPSSAKLKKPPAISLSEGKVTVELSADFSYGLLSVFGQDKFTLKVRSTSVPLRR